MEKIIFLALLSIVLLAFSAHAQWNTASNNYTTAKLAIGYSGPPNYDIDISRAGGAYIRIHNPDYSNNPTVIAKKGGIIFNQQSGDKTAGIQFAVPPGYHVPGILFSTKEAWNIPGSGTTDWLDRMFIHPNGFVGIGTISPSALLAIENSNPSTTKPNVSLRLSNPTSTLDQKSGAALEFASSVGLSKIAGIDERASLNGEYRGALSFITRYHVGGNDAGFFERMRINAVGDVGIGTSSPTSRLSVISEGASQGKPVTVLNINVPNSNFDSKSGSAIEFGSNIGLAKVAGVDERTSSTGMWQGGLSFYTRYHMDGNDLGFYERMRITSEGKVGIGIINPDAKLAVKGDIHAHEVRVDLNGTISPPDYVFEDTYKLPTLTEVETYIKENKHLPEVPSAKQMEAEGLKLMEMNLLLLKKVEELTLYMIQQNKQLELQAEINNEQRKLNAEQALKIEKQFQEIDALKKELANNTANRN